MRVIVEAASHGLPNMMDVINLARGQGSSIVKSPLLLLEMSGFWQVPINFTAPIRRACRSQDHGSSGQDKTPVC